MAEDPRAELADLIAGFRTHLEWQRRAGAWAAPAGPSPRPASAIPAADGVDDPGPGAPGRRTLEQVRAELGDCQRCKLAGTRRNIVFGNGDPHAPLVFIGEAPGEEEDRRGLPFVGKAGQLLDKMIEAMGWTRDAVYVGNTLKCRPPGNRNPEPDETAACEPFLSAQLQAIRPRMIVTLGKPAAQLLLRSSAPISALRGKFHDWRGIPVMPTFHPAFLLRSPERKRDTWDDLKQVIAALQRLGIMPPRPPKA
jgi:uracil-DNA glycosylase